MALGHFQPKKPTVKGSAKFLIKRAVVAAAPGWIPALAVIFPILLLFLVVIFILGAAASSIPFANELGLGSTFHPTSIPTPTPNPNPDPDPGPGPLPDEAPPCNVIDRELRSNFGVVVVSRGETLSCEDKRWLYRIYSVPFKYSGFKRQIKPSDPFVIYTLRDNNDGRCSGYVPTSRYMEIKDLQSCIRSISSVADFDFKRVSMFVIHESGHLIKNRNLVKLYFNYPNARLKAQDPGCYDRGFVKTYSLRTTDPVSENMAEATGLFIVNSKLNIVDFRIQIIANFRTQCPALYNWIKQNLYD